MENWNLKDLGVQEMNETELMNVEGGKNIFEAAWDWICEAAEDVWDWITHLKVSINDTCIANC
jgi:bacteriocin-like protein